MKESGITHWNSPNIAADNISGFIIIASVASEDDSAYKHFGNSV